MFDGVSGHRRHHSHQTSNNKSTSHSSRNYGKNRHSPANPSKANYHNSQNGQPKSDRSNTEFNIKSNKSDVNTKYEQPKLISIEIDSDVENDRTTAGCYYLNNASLAIFCKGFPKNTQANQIIDFFGVYGEILSYQYNAKKRICKIAYYDIRSACNAVISLRSHKFDDYKITANFIENFNVTSNILLRIIDKTDTPPPPEEIHKFARSFGDYQNIELKPGGYAVIRFYDKRQVDQCVSLKETEISGAKYEISDYFENNQTFGEDEEPRKDFLISADGTNIYNPPINQFFEFHERLFKSIMSLNEKVKNAPL
ncbi:hypothetical protein TRFO_42850 [Tritrichomonas foetus]|uniref:RRM domain-containing protein n=1 Tax=Tritrichomonas foetus TaxID=1144522 RepID=A0A1J4KUC4_9EUKA|nr:hypothetical protein TRFO_42850 [Tritrichomonas foetus]|eukprot:OHT14871.1 hypothetical protein TRFO_42850 [Tritrichomonas foetus]